MDRQELLDATSRHLLTQARRAISVHDADSCMYRTGDGLKCAIGALIPDERYYPKLENQGVDSKDVLEALGWSQDEITDLKGMAERLQNIHDNMPVGAWPKCLKQFAIQEGLSAAKVHELEASFRARLKEVEA